MLDMREARQRLKMRLSDLQNLTGIPVPVLSMIETGRQKPSARSRSLITAAIGKVEFLQGGFNKMTAPQMPQMVWNRDGKPDFSHLESNEANQGSVRDQLETLIAEDYDHILDTEEGDFTEVKVVHPESMIYEVHTDGQSEIFRQSYSVENGKAVLGDDASRVPPEEFAILSRRRIPKQGVSEAPTGFYQGEGAKRRFVLNEDED